MRPREPDAPYARVGKGRKRTFPDHSHQVGCLRERAAFDCYPPNVPHMEYHPDRGGLGGGPLPAVSPPEMVIGPSYCVGPSLNQ